MNIILGQFIPTGSVIESMDARVKIISTLIYIIAVFMCNSFIGFSVCAVFLIAVIMLSRLPVGMILKSLKGMLFILLFTVVMNLLFTHSGSIAISFGIIRVTDEALINTAVIFTRLVLVIMFPSMLTLTTKPMELTIAIEDLLSPLRHFKVPVSELAMMMGIALRFIPTLYDELDKIKKAQLSRGAAFDEGSVYNRIKALTPVIVPLFVSSFRRADEMAMAMEARCYISGVKRSRLNNPKLGIKDYTALIIMLIFIVFIIILENLI